MNTTKKQLFLLILTLFFTASFLWEPFADAAVSVPQPPQLEAEASASGVKLTWTQSAAATGYRVYRKETVDGPWERLATLQSKTSLTLTNRNVENNCIYRYAVKAYNSRGESSFSAVSVLLWLDPPAITRFSKSRATLTVRWSKNQAATGYQLQYCKNRLFQGAKTITIKDPSVTARSITGLSSTSAYYVRIRVYAELGHQRFYSPWSLSSNAKSTKTASLHRLKRGKSAFELRKQAKQRLYQYDTVQGGCSWGSYGYFVLYNRNMEKCKIAKVNLSTRKVVKVSPVLHIAHGSDLTYNPDQNLLIAAHGSTQTRKVSIINPKTLRVVSSKTLSLPKKLPGLSEARRSAFRGITAIAYNTKHDQYVARIKTLGDLLILDKNLNPVRYIRLAKKDKQTYQGMDSADDYILMGQSFKGSKPWNIISIYDWEGNYLSKINVRRGYELQNIFHRGSNFYASFYTSYYETYYVKGFKIKKVRGKKRKVRTRLKYTRLMRVNYIYKIGNF